MENRLHPENCNKAKCKTCIFGKTPLNLREGRMNEIKEYLSDFSATHICHTTNLTCYGATEFQAELLHRKGILKEPTVECLLEQAKEYFSI
jgi:hypothetical protein